MANNAARHARLKSMAAKKKVRCFKLAAGWWRLLVEDKDGTTPIMDVLTRGRGINPMLHITEYGGDINPRTGRPWKSAKEILKFLGVKKVEKP